MQKRDLSFGYVVQWVVERSPYGSVVQWIIERYPIRLCITMCSREISHQVLQYSGQQRILPLVLQYIRQQNLQQSPVRFFSIVDSREISHYGSVVQWIVERFPMTFCCRKIVERSPISRMDSRNISRQILQYNGYQRDLPVGSVVQWIVEIYPSRFCCTIDSREISDWWIAEISPIRSFSTVESREISYKVLQYNRQQRDLPLLDNREIPHQVPWYNGYQYMQSRDLPFGSIVHIAERSSIKFCCMLDSREIFLWFCSKVDSGKIYLWFCGRMDSRQFVEQWIAERCYIRFCSTMDNREISYKVL